MKKDWEIKKLGDVCNVYNGSTPLRRKKEYWENGNINWFTVEDIREQGRIIRNTKQKITESGFKSTSLKLLPKNSILLCCTASVGEYAMTEIELATNQQFNGLVIKNENELLSKYLFYFSSTLKDKLLEVSGKTTIDFVSMTKVRNIPIPIPPLPEQKRIVAILDRAFEAIDKAKANAEQNLKNAKELFESYLQSVFENKGGDWEERKIKDLGKVQTGSTPPTKDKSNYGDFIPFAKPPHFKQNGEIDTGESMLSEKGLKKGRLFDANSVLMVCIGATIGKTGFSNKPISSNQQINGLTPSKEYEPRFFYYAFISGVVQKQVLKQGKSAQATLPIINKTKWENILVPFSKSLETQKQIVQKLDVLQVETKKLEAIYQQKIDNLEELKKSILQKVFNGQLTMNNG